MNFSELIASVSADTSMAKEGVKTILEAAVATLTWKASVGDDTVLAAFGQFKVKNVPARQGRNPGSMVGCDVYPIDVDALARSSLSGLKMGETKEPKRVWRRIGTYRIGCVSKVVLCQKPAGSRM